MAGHVWEDYAEEQIKNELQKRLSAINAHGAILASVAPVLSNTSVLDAQIQHLEATIQQKEAELVKNSTWLRNLFGTPDTATVELAISTCKTEHAELVAARNMVLTLQSDIQMLQGNITALQSRAVASQPIVTSCSTCSKNAYAPSSFDEQKYKAEIVGLEKEITRLENELQAALSTNGAGYTPEQITVIKEALQKHAERSLAKTKEKFDFEFGTETDKFKNTRWRQAFKGLFSAGRLFYLRELPPEADYYEELIPTEVLNSQKQFDEVLDQGFSGSLAIADSLFKEQYSARTTRSVVTGPGIPPGIDTARVKKATIALAKYMVSNDPAVFGVTYEDHVKTLGSSFLPPGTNLISIQEQLEQALAREFTIPDLEDIIVGNGGTIGDAALPLHEVLAFLPYDKKTDPAFIRLMMQRVADFSSTLQISLHPKIGSESHDLLTVSDVADIGKYNIWRMLSNESINVNDIILSLANGVAQSEWVKRMKAHTSANLGRQLAWTQNTKNKKTWAAIYRVYRTLFLVTSEVYVSRNVWPAPSPLQDRSTWEDSSAFSEKAIISMQQEVLDEKVIKARLQMQKRYDSIFTETERRDACASAGLDYADELAKASTNKMPTDAELEKYIKLSKRGIPNPAVIAKMFADGIAKELIDKMEEYLRNKT
jgi:Subunit CCDC53 of WASH complex